MTDQESLLKKIIRGQIPDEYRSILRVFENDNFFAPVASGSSVPTHMVVVPCTTGTISRIWAGTSECLIDRAADVVLKEKRSLILCVRETPLSSIHLRNMLDLSNMGAIMVPATPGFYHHPKTIDDLVDFYIGKILDLLEIEHHLLKRWNHRLI